MVIPLCSLAQDNIVSNFGDKTIKTRQYFSKLKKKEKKKRKGLKHKKKKISFRKHYIKKHGNTKFRKLKRKD